jgi:hypothetical protein
LPVTFSGWGGGGVALNETNWGREKKHPIAAASHEFVSPLGIHCPFQLIMNNCIRVFLYAGLQNFTCCLSVPLIFTDNALALTGPGMDAVGLDGSLNWDAEAPAGE